MAARCTRVERDLQEERELFALRSQEQEKTNSENSEAIRALVTARLQCGRRGPPELGHRVRKRV